MRCTRPFLVSAAAGKDVDKLLSALVAECSLSAPPAPHSQDSSQGLSEPPPPMPTLPDTLFFTERVMRRNPGCFFDEILTQWEATVETAVRNPSSTAASVLHATHLRESQLLNAKLHEDQFDHPKHGPAASKAGAPDSTGCEAVPSVGREVLGCHALRGATDYKTDRSTSEVGGDGAGSQPRLCPDTFAESTESTPTTACNGFKPSAAEFSGRQACSMTNAPHGDLSITGFNVSLFRYYSIAHFAAELDSVELLRFAAEELRDGVPMYYRPDQVFTVDGCAPQPTSVTTMPTGLVGDCHGRGRGAFSRAFPTFDWLARNCADYAGHYLIHRAAMADAAESLAFLVRRFGEEDMFQLKRAPSLIGGTRWGATTYQKGKNAAGCAIAAGSTRALAWILANCPRQLQLSSTELSAAMISAALEDTVQTFEFFTDHKLFPKLLSDSGSTGGAAIADAVLVEGLSAVLDECGCRAALYAAAESGSDDVIQWYIRTFGEEVLWVPDKTGATALHHCARGGNTATLRQLLLDRRTTDCPNAYKHVDDFDSLGRTPAMWCVQGGRKGKHVVDTLQLLESVGSRWRVLENERGDTVADVATRYHRPFTKVARFLKASVS